MKSAVVFCCLLLAGVTTPTSDATLVWNQSALEPIYVLTRGMEFEVMACLSGDREGKTTTIRGVLLPPQITTTLRVLRSGPCPKGTRALFHTHSWQGVDVANGWLTPRDVCYLSPTDLATARESKWEWFAVGVGRWSADSVLLCWWSKEDVVAAKGPWLPAIETQGMYLWGDVK